MVVPSGLMRHIRTKHCQPITHSAFSVNACHVKRHRFFQPLKNFVIPLPRNRCGNFCALFLFCIGCPILSVRQIRHCQILINMNRVGPILTIHTIISGLKRPRMTIAHVSRRRIHALLMVLTRRIINRRELPTATQPGCRLITIYNSTFLRKRVQCISIRQTATCPIRRFSTRQKGQALMIHFFRRRTRDLPRRHMRAFLYKRIHFITKCTHPGRHKHINNIIT